MAECQMNEIRKEIELYYDSDGKNGVNGIMNAFRRAVDGNEDLYVITENVIKDGRNYNMFLILRDSDGHSIFPLFTDISEMMAVKNKVKSDNKLNTGIMKLNYVLNTLLEKKICDGIIVNPSSQSFTAPVSFIEDIFNR